MVLCIRDQRIRAVEKRIRAVEKRIGAIENIVGVGEVIGWGSGFV